MKAFCLFLPLVAIVLMFGRDPLNPPEPGPPAAKSSPKRVLATVAALGGVSFAVILIFMQLGFRAAMLDSSVR